MKQDETTKVISQQNDLKLILHVKTISEHERRRDLSNLTKKKRG